MEEKVSLRTIENSFVALLSQNGRIEPVPRVDPGTRDSTQEGHPVLPLEDNQVQQAQRLKDCGPWITHPWMQINQVEPEQRY